MYQSRLLYSAATSCNNILGVQHVMLRLLRELLEFTACAAGLKRKIVGLPDGLSRLQGRLMDFVPGKPFSSDNYLSLKIDNCSVENGLWRLGIQPRSIESVVPMYLRGSSRQHHLDHCRKQVED